MFVCSVTISGKPYGLDGGKQYTLVAHPVGLRRRPALLCLSTRRQCYCPLKARSPTMGCCNRLPSALAHACVEPSWGVPSCEGTGRDHHLFAPSSAQQQ